MSYKIVKLDKRHTGHEYFTHAIDINAVKIFPPSKSPFVQSIQFQIIIIWFWQTYGPSADYDIWLKCQALPVTRDNIDTLAVKDWAWETGYGKHRIFISDAAVLTHFILTHPIT